MTLSVEYLTTPANGETENGDRPFYRRENGHALLAVIDVLGHGPRAAVVAKAAVDHLETVTISDDVERIAASLHEALHGTRGAQAVLCVVSDRRLRGCGVGNVEIRIQGSRVPTFLNPGIIGQYVRRFNGFEGTLRDGDRVVCFSDGISQRLDLDAVRHLGTRDACRAIFDRHRKGHDDATVLVADVEPSPA